jgi:hypothetical protein
MYSENPRLKEYDMIKTKSCVRNSKITVDYIQSAAGFEEMVAGESLHVRRFEPAGQL